MGSLPYGMGLRDRGGDGTRAVKCMAELSSRRRKRTTSCSQRPVGWVKAGSDLGAQTESHQGPAEGVWRTWGCRRPAGSPGWTHRAEQGERAGRPQECRLLLHPSGELRPKPRGRRKCEPGSPVTHFIHAGQPPLTPAGSRPARLPTGQDRRARVSLFITLTYCPRRTRCSARVDGPGRSQVPPGSPIALRGQQGRWGAGRGGGLF